MNPEQLADELDLTVPPKRGQLTQADGEHPLIQAASRLANAPQPQLSPEAKARIQAKMLQAMPPQPRLFPIQALKWVAAVLLVIIFGIGGSYPLMANSVPGDLFYPLKRQVVEPIELALANSPAEQVETHLRLAGRRLHEADVLLARGTLDDTLIQDAQFHIQSADRIAVAFNLDVQQEIALLDAQITQLVVQHEPLSPSLPETPTAIITPLQSTVVVVAPTDTAVIPTMTSTPSSTPTPSPTTELVVMMIYSTERVNVRAGAGLNYDVIVRLAPGTLVTILSEEPSAEWVQIETPSGIVGWVAGFLLADPDTPLPNDTPSNEEATQASDNDAGSEDCTLPGSACYAPGHGNNPPPGQGGIPPGLVDKTPGPPGN
ncbi:MAG: hypothetical protein Kow00117_13230 [Phototrophicales bacterium]